MDITSKEIAMLQEDVYNLSCVIYDLLTSNPKDLDILSITSELQYIIDRNKSED